MISRGRFFTLLAVLALIVAALVAVGLGPKLRQRAALAAGAEKAGRPPRVRVVKVERLGASAELDLPADLQSLIEAPIYARVDGYIGKRAAEIGASVKRGDLLAVLETPELDQQILQAKAALSQARAALKRAQAEIGETIASLKLARITASRWKQLSEEGILSRQEADEKQAQLDVQLAQSEASTAAISASEEAVRAAEANVQRLQEMKSFGELRAPFDGIITYRNPDVGTLINSGATAGREVFRVTDLTVIRAFVSIPQSHVPYIQPGVPAVLRVDDIPNRTWKATVSNIAHALDPGSRTMLAVIKINNPDIVLKPGMYSRIIFTLPMAPDSLVVPGDALVGRNDGSYVAAVDSNSKVRFRKVSIARDFGAKVALSAGVKEGETVLLSPGDDIREGSPVEVVTK